MNQNTMSIFEKLMENTKFYLTFNQEIIILSALLIMLAVVAARLLFSKNLLDSIIILSFFSLIISACYLLMDAPDVSMTEVALGVCFSGAVLLNMSIYTGERYNRPKKIRLFFASLLPLTLVIVMGIADADLPSYGQIDAPLHLDGNVSEYYIQNTRTEIGIPSVVAAVLASYRGFDTLGEAGVILIAGLAVALILSKKE